MRSPGTAGRVCGTDGLGGCHGGAAVSEWHGLAPMTRCLVYRLITNALGQDDGSLLFVPQGMTWCPLLLIL